VAYLRIEDLEEVLQRHISLSDIGAAVATTVAAPKITTKRTLPEECTQLMTLDHAIVYAPKELKSDVFTQS